MDDDDPFDSVVCQDGAGGFDVDDEFDSVTIEYCEPQIKRRRERKKKKILAIR